MDRPPCVPIEVEMQPLYRSPPGTARLRREQKRRERSLRRQRKAAAPTRASRVFRSSLTRIRSWRNRS